MALFAQQATGLSYDQLLSEYVLDPLSLRTTTMPEGYRMVAPYVHGYSDGPGSRQDESELLNASIIWASGGMVSTPLDLSTFIRAYGGGKLITGATRTAQLMFRPGSSDPPGPGTNAAGLAIFRYQTSCGTVYGHTGNLPGYTAFIASTPDGSRSVTLTLSTQIDTKVGAFLQFHRVEELAVCAALARA